MSPRKKLPSESEAVQQARKVGGLSESCVQMSANLRRLHPTDPRDIEQVQKEFVQAYTSAQERVWTFEQQVAAFGLRFHVPATCRPGGVKKLERMVEKYRNSLQLPLDLLAAKVVVDSLWELYDVAWKVSQLFSVVAYRDRVVVDQKGYRDLQFVVDVDGHYAEVKVIHRLIDELDGYEHRIYEIRRSLIARQKSLDLSTQDPLVLSSIEQLVLNKLRATSTNLFNDAWQLVVDAEKPALNTPIKYYLVGRVPVRMQERSDGVSLVAFNPLLGGFVSTARYYSAIKDKTGEAREIDEAEFHHQVEVLKSSEFYVPATT